MRRTLTEAEERLVEFVSRELVADRDEPLAVDEDLLGSGLVNSLGVMRLISHVEEQYGLSVPREDVTIEHFATVRKIVDYLEKLRDRTPRTSDE